MRTIAREENGLGRLANLCRTLLNLLASCEYRCYHIILNITLGIMVRFNSSHGFSLLALTNSIHYVLIQITFGIMHIILVLKTKVQRALVTHSTTKCTCC